jgi:hypothetical protein
LNHFLAIICGRIQAYLLYVKGSTNTGTHALLCPTILKDDKDVAEAVEEVFDWEEEVTCPIA